MMTDPHESERYLVRWAKAKALDFEERERRFLNDNSTFTLDIEFNRDTREQIHKIRLRNEIPWELRGIASDAVKAIRDALDQCCLHCTQRIDSAASRKRRGKRTHFPFGESPSDFDKVLSGEAGGQSKDIAPELHDGLRSFEPYPTGEGHVGGNDGLRLIGRVSGPNKHELTMVVGLTTNSFQFGKVTPLSGHGFDLMHPCWDRAKNEAVVAKTHIDAHLTIEMGIFSFLEFDHPLLAGAPVRLVLKRWADITDSIVESLIAETDRVLSG